MNLAITCIIIIVYLIMLFGVSAWAQKKQKKAEAEGSTGNFLIARKSLPTILVAFMMAGAGIGSINTTGIAQQVQTAGLSGICVGLAGTVALIVLGLVGAKRMRALPYNTMPSMAMAYCGSGTRWMLSIGGFVMALAIAALQFVGGGAMLASMFPGVITNQVGMIITAVVFLGIAMLGGFLGASLANFVNMFIMYIGLFLVLIAALTAKNIGGVKGLITAVNAIPEPTSSGAPWLSVTGGLGLATFISYFATEIPNRFTTQSNTQQIFAAKDGKAARNGIVIGALMMIPVTIMSCMIGLIARVQFPNLAADGTTVQALPLVVMSVNPFISGIGMAALCAVNVSTGIALLMTCAQLFCNDILAPVNKKREMTEHAQALQGRFALIGIAVLGLIMAFYLRSIVSTIMTLHCITAAFIFIFVPILFFPQLLRKSTGVALLAVSYLFFLIWLLVPGLKSAFPDPVYPEWGLALLTFLVCLLLDKRRITVPDGDA
ncbi:MAG: sodium:solute symporter family protein, partial [Oscillospiraceae bacterium]|nr:sodium:solute symporter family protein [Oscillospiraceae bacterium]